MGIPRLSLTFISIGKNCINQHLFVFLPVLNEQDQGS